MNIKSIFILVASFTFSLIYAKNANSCFKLYCLYTPLFENLYEKYFLPSIQDDIEIVVKNYSQSCPSGIYNSEGWRITMLHKLDLLRFAIYENWDHIFIYSDVDIIFMKPILTTVLEYLSENDFVAQQGWPSPNLCA